MGGAEVYFHVFLTSALSDEPAVLLSRKETLDRRLGGPQRRSFRCGEDRKYIASARNLHQFLVLSTNSIVTIATEFSRLIMKFLIV
jgi:hypothetical protein